MSARPPATHARLPTLTEVVDAAPPAEAGAGEPASAPIDQAELVASILAALQQKADLMLEYRLRESLAPVLARAADMVIREARQELSATLADIVARAVAQELARRRR